MMKTNCASKVGQTGAVDVVMLTHIVIFNEKVNGTTGRQPVSGVGRGALYCVK